MKNAYVLQARFRSYLLATQDLVFFQWS